MTKKLHCAEFVFPGHPDKLSDAIADALVQEAGQREKRALVGVEVAVPGRYVGPHHLHRGQSRRNSRHSPVAGTVRPITGSVG